MNDRLRVLVTCASSTAGLARIRELGSAGHEVLGVTDQPLPLGLRSRYSTRYRTCPPFESPDFGADLLEIVRQTKPDVVFPLTSMMVRAILRQRKAFDELTRVVLPPSRGFVAAADNALTLVECSRLGIPCPRVFDLEQAERRLADGAVSSSDRCVVVKPRQDLGKGKGLSFVNDPQSLGARVSQTRSSHGEVVIQEYIPGGPSAMRTLIVLFSRESRLLAYFMTRKIQIWPMDCGITALSESFHDRRLLEMVLPFFEKWRWQGPAEIEFKVDPRDDRPKVIEINPRFPSYSGFPRKCGMPLIEMAASAVMGQWKWQVCPSYETGVRYVNLPAYSKVILTELWRGGRRNEAISEALGVAARGFKLNGSDITDPLPRIGKWLLVTKQGLKALRYSER